MEELHSAPQLAKRGQALGLILRWFFDSVVCGACARAGSETQDAKKQLIRRVTVGASCLL